MHCDFIEVQDGFAVWKEFRTSRDGQVERSAKSRTEATQHEEPHDPGLRKAALARARGGAPRAPPTPGFSRSFA